MLNQFVRGYAIVDAVMVIQIDSHTGVNYDIFSKRKFLKNTSELLVVNLLFI